MIVADDGNCLLSVYVYLERDSRPVPLSEMKAFWDALTFDEKQRFAVEADKLLQKPKRKVAFAV